MDLNDQFHDIILKHLKKGSPTHNLSPINNTISMQIITQIKIHNADGMLNVCYCYKIVSEIIVMNAC